MPFPSFLHGRTDQQRYARFGNAKMVSEDGSRFDWTQEEDQEFLISKDQGMISKEMLTASPKTPQRFMAFPSPRRSSRDPCHGTMTLLVRRMDDTTFALVVSKKATLNDLKESIKQKFEGEGSQISWPHVWRHFCLSFRGQKLIEDHLVLYKLGVRDLDELMFMRHLDTRSSKVSQTGYFSNTFRWMHKLVM